MLRSASTISIRRQRSQTGKPIRDVPPEHCLQTRLRDGGLHPSHRNENDQTTSSPCPPCHGESIWGQRSAHIHTRREMPADIISEPAGSDSLASHGHALRQPRRQVVSASTPTCTNASPRLSKTVPFSKYGTVSLKRARPGATDEKVRSPNPLPSQRSMLRGQLQQLPWFRVQHLRQLLDGAQRDVPA